MVLLSCCPDTTLESGGDDALCLDFDITAPDETTAAPSMPVVGSRFCLTVPLKHLRSRRLDLISETFKFNGLRLCVRILQRTNQAGREYVMSSDVEEPELEPKIVAYLLRRAIPGTSAGPRKEHSHLQATWTVYSQQASAPNLVQTHLVDNLGSEPICQNDVYSPGVPLTVDNSEKYAGPNGSITIGLRLM